MTHWIRTYEDPYGLEFVEHRNGIEWADAPLPHRWHRCRAQTRALMYGETTERCACGAVRLGKTVWINRNTRRREVTR